MSLMFFRFRNPNLIVPRPWNNQKLKIWEVLLFFFSERSPYISANTFRLILSSGTHYYTIYIVYSIPELPSPILKKARYMVFHIFSLLLFLPWILNVFLVCSGGVFKVKESIGNNSEVQKCEFPYVLLLNCLYHYFHHS